MRKNKLTIEEKANIVRAVRKAANAMAEFWDVLREVEIAHNVEFDGTADYIGVVAADCSTPPDLEHDLRSEKAIIDGVLELEV